LAFREDIIINHLLYYNVNKSLVIL